MARVRYSRSSPYAATPQGSQFLGNYVHRRIVGDAGDKLYELQPHHDFRPDKLSQELYGSPKFWWIFMARNMNLIRDPLNDFRAGLTIVVPTIEHLRRVLGF